VGTLIDKALCRSQSDTTFLSKTFSAACYCAVAQITAINNSTSVMLSSEQRERSRSISDSFTPQRETGPGFRIREALHFLKLINGALH
jgi:hypothetical protein